MTSSSGQRGMLRNGGRTREMRRAEGLDAMGYCLSLPVNVYLVPHAHVHVDCNIIKYLIKHIFEQ